MSGELSGADSMNPLQTAGFKAPTGFEPVLCVSELRTVEDSHGSFGAAGSSPASNEERVERGICWASGEPSPLPPSRAFVVTPLEAAEAHAGCPGTSAASSAGRTRQTSPALASTSGGEPKQDSSSPLTTALFGAHRVPSPLEVLS